MQDANIDERFEGKPLSGPEANFKSDMEDAVKKLKGAGGKIDWLKVLEIVMAVIKSFRS